MLFYFYTNRIGTPLDVYLCVKTVEATSPLEQDLRNIIVLVVGRRTSLDYLTIPSSNSFQSALKVIHEFLFHSKLDLSGINAKIHRVAQTYCLIRRDRT
jgi:hypothetical protein